MHRILLKLISTIQLTRLTIAFGAVSDIWFVILLTRATADSGAPAVVTMSLVAALGLGFVIAVGMFAYGAALNDILDVRHDSMFSPERPIPAGHIRIGQAIVVTVGALIITVLASSAFGTWAAAIALLTAGAVLFYNAAGKYIPAFGLPTIGMIHAAHMLIPNHALAFTLPLWLIMTHAFVIAAVVHRLEDKRPRLRQRSTVAAIVGWALCSGMVIGLGMAQDEGVWPEERSLTNVLWVVLAILGFLVVARWKTRGVTRPVAAEKLKRYGAMWQCLYASAWFAALGYHAPAIWLAAVALVGFATMTIVKELTGMTGTPVGYR